LKRANDLILEKTKKPDPEKTENPNLRNQKDLILRKPRIQTLKTKTDQSHKKILRPMRENRIPEKKS
jgi:hypothetical protein